ncbi:hypothetical protein MMPV_009595 [Pyropia vietnamensis]
MGGGGVAPPPPRKSVGSTLTVTTVGSTISSSTVTGTAAGVHDELNRLAERHSFGAPDSRRPRLRSRSSAVIPTRSFKGAGGGLLARLESSRHRGSGGSRRNGGGGMTWAASFKIPSSETAQLAAEEEVPRGGLLGGGGLTAQDHDRVDRLRSRGVVATASLAPGEWDAENAEDMAELAVRVQQGGGGGRGRPGGGSPPGEKGRAATRRPQNVKVNIMRQAVVREPATLRLSRLGRSPVHDGFVVVANAVRRELMDLYYMLASMSKRTLSLSSLDIEEFISWLPGLRSYLTEVLFTFEMETLLPALANIIPTGSQPTLLRTHPRPLQATHTRLLSLLEAVEATPNTYAHQPPGALLKQILVAVDAFAPVVLQHLDVLTATFLPQLVGVLGLRSRRRSSTMGAATDMVMNGSSEEADRLGNILAAGLFKAVSEASDPGAAAAATVRPLREPGVADAWTETLLNVCGGGPLARIKWRRVVVDGSRRWRRQHVGIVRRFYKRWAAEYISVRGELPVAANEEHVDRDVWGKAEIEVDSE